MQLNQEGRAGALRFAPLWAAVAIAMLGALSTARTTVFTSNQHTYLAHAAAATSRFEILRNDWFVDTKDPTPLFTALVGPILGLGNWALVLLNVVLGAVLLLSLASVASFAKGAARDDYRALASWSVVISLLWALLPGSVRSILFDGVADQRAFTDYLQPSNGGVFLVLALAAALRTRPLLAVAAGAIAACIHPTYAISSLVLTLGVAASCECTRSRLGAFGLGTLCVTPLVALTYRAFCPTAPELARRASEVLVFDRFPWHALPSNWFGATAAIRLLIVVAAILLTHGSARVLLLVCAGLGALLTLVATLFGRPELLMLFPWRTTIWLVPVSCALVLGTLSRFVSWSHYATSRRFRISVAAGAALLFMRVVTRSAHAEAAGDDQVGMGLLRKVSVANRERWVFLIPVEWESARLNAPASVYVDFKSHPYQDTEVLEWWARLSRARDIYAAAGPAACERLNALLEREPRLGFVIAPRRSDLASCDRLEPIANNADGVLLGVRGRAPR